MSNKGHMNDILWIGAISWLKNGKYKPPAKYPGIVSASSFQQAMIEGLEKHGRIVRILSDSDIFSGKREIWKHSEDGLDDVRVAGVGNKILRLPIKTLNLCREISRNKRLIDSRVVVVYEMHIPYLFALRKIKRNNPNIVSVLICPDLTSYMDVDIAKKRIKRILKLIENKLAQRLLRYVDGYVFFTEHMSEQFQGHLHKPSVVIEGVFNEDKYEYSRLEKAKPPYIIHSGSLHTKMGIEELIEAFSHIKRKDVELHFFGSGEMDDYIHNAESSIKGIKHHGFVDPRNLFEYEKRASLIVNVRNPKEQYTRYSFPSKTFEFLASGTPLLCTDMEGIPSEYKKHMLLIPDNSIEAIQKALDDYFELPVYEQDALGIAAQTFVRQEKNSLKQSQILIDMIDALLKVKN